MTVVLTGATGLVGSAVLQALLDAGHEVTALVRSEESAAKVTAAGAAAVVGDLGDSDWVREQFAGTDGAIHTASPGDASSADFDRAVADAAVAAFEGTGRPYIHTGGIWVHGSGTGITEETPLDPPALTAWRHEVEQIVLAPTSLRGVVIEPAVVYGGGQGIPALVATPDQAGDFRLVGDGSQHWTTVAADQLARLYVLALESPDARGYYIGASGDAPTVRELAEAAAAAAGGGPVVAETVEESEARFGAPFTQALLLDQQAAPGRAQHELGWRHDGPSLVETIAAGAFA